MVVNERRNEEHSSLPIWVSGTSINNIAIWGTESIRFKYAIKSYSKNRFVSKNPLYFWQNHIIK